LFDELERRFSDNFARTAENVLVPNVDVKETPEQYEVDVDLPGMKENEVEIDLSNSVLTISAHKETNKEGDEKSDKKWLVRERNVRSYTRRFTLPNDTDPAKIAARFEDGVLSVSIPRKEEAKSRKIPITAGASLLQSA
jgi:HSP20 family protein